MQTLETCFPDQTTLSSRSGDGAGGSVRSSAFPWFLLSLPSVLFDHPPTIWVTSLPLLSSISLLALFHSHSPVLSLLCLNHPFLPLPFCLSVCPFLCLSVSLVLSDCTTSEPIIHKQKRADSRCGSGTRTQTSGASKASVTFRHQGQNFGDINTFPKNTQKESSSINSPWRVSGCHLYYISECSAAELDFPNSIFARARCASVGPIPLPYISCPSPVGRG